MPYFEKPIESPTCPICDSKDTILLGARSDFGPLDWYAQFVEDINRFDRFIYKCPGCLLSFIFPMYDPDDLEMLYNTAGYKQMAMHAGADVYNTDHLTPKYHNLDIAQWKDTNFGKDGNPQYLDVGCGYGSALRFFESQGFQTEGVDISEHYQFMNQHLRSNIHLSSFEDFSPSHKYDLISALHMIEHVLDLNAFITKCKSLLNSNSLLFIETPFLEDGGQYENRFRDIYHTHFFNHYCLNVLCNKHGLNYYSSHLVNFFAYDYYHSYLCICYQPDAQLEPNSISRATAQTKAFEALYLSSVDLIHAHLNQTIVDPLFDRFNRQSYAKLSADIDALKLEKAKILKNVSSLNEAVMIKENHIEELQFELNKKSALLDDLNRQLADQNERLEKINHKYQWYNNSLTIKLAKALGLFKGM